MSKRLVVGISGATGAVYAIRLLEVVRAMDDVEVHLVVSPSARRTIELETDTTAREVERLADVVHKIGDIAAPISSGSFRTDGMVVVPCSVRTASGIAHSYGENLLIRAADVVLKERRRLVLVVRETPLHLGHLRVLTQLAELGAVVMPPVPAFYARPETITELVDHTVARILDLLDVSPPESLCRRWNGVTAWAAPAEGAVDAPAGGHA